MADAPKDGNFIRGKLGVLNTDGVTTIPIAINEATGAMKITTSATISFTMTPLAPRDANYNKCMLFVGSDGLTYPWVCDENGAVLVDE